MRCFRCGLFYLPLIVRFLFVVDILFFLFRIACWSSAGKELSPSLSASAVLFHGVLTVCIPFPFGVRERMWNSVVSVPDHCLFICFNKNESCIFITFVISLLLQNLFSYWLLKVDTFQWKASNISKRVRSLDILIKIVYIQNSLYSKSMKVAWS